MITNIDTSHTYSSPEIKLALTLKDGTVINIGSELLYEAPTINKRAVSDDSFMYGAAYIGECKFSFISDMRRYLLYDAEVKVIYTDNRGRVEKGTFYIAEAAREYNYITVTAYDGISKLDKHLPEDISGTAFELITHICTTAGIEPAQSRFEIEALTNGRYEYKILAEKVSTCRDAVSYLAKMMCCFVTMSNEGRLKFCPLRVDIENAITKNASQRLNVKISDFNTRYGDVKAVFSDGKEYSSQGINVGALSMDLGDIPIVYGFSRNKQRMIDDIMSELSKVDYTPCELDILHDPYIEIGDTVYIPNAAQTGFDVYAVVCELTWEFANDCHISAVGDNPLITKLVASASGESSSAISDDIKRNFLVQTTTNSKDNIISDIPIQLIYFITAAVANTTAVFVATIQFTLDRDGTVCFEYYLDGVHDESADLYSEFKRGKHFVTLHRYLHLDSEKQHTLAVTVHTAQRAQGAETDTAVYMDIVVKEDDFYLDGEFENCKYRADIPIDGLMGAVGGSVMFDYDTATSYYFAPIAIVREGMVSIYTRRMPRADVVIPMIKLEAAASLVPTMTVHNRSVRASLFGQGITGDAWDGNVSAYDSVQPVRFGTYSATVYDTAESANAEVKAPLSNIISENISPVFFGKIGITPSKDEAYINRVIYNAVFYEADFISGEDYMYIETDISDTSITGIEKVTATGTGSPLYAVSFGADPTWHTHNGAAWQALSDNVSGMTADSLSRISVTQWNEKLFINGEKIDCVRIRFVMQAEGDGVTSIFIDYTN